MRKENVELEIERVEVVTKEYDKNNRIKRETFEFWYPKEESKTIGFNTKPQK